MSYTGSLLPNGLRHGKGTYTYPSVFKYTGEWFDGIKSGHGVLSMGDLGHYEGNFKDGEITGVGFRQYADGSTYSGNFIRGERNGQGVYINPAIGVKYEGEWRNNQYCGEGELTFPNGDVFEGMFYEHRRSGHGILTCANGDRYEGDWKDNKRDGYGIAEWHNGDKYDGEWMADNRHGFGNFIDGITNIHYDAEWVSDIPVKIPNSIHLHNTTQASESKEAEQKSTKKSKKPADSRPHFSPNDTLPSFDICVLSEIQHEEAEAVVDSEVPAKVANTASTDSLQSLAQTTDYMKFVVEGESNRLINIQIEHLNPPPPDAEAEAEQEEDAEEEKEMQHFVAFQIADESPEATEASTKAAESTVQEKKQTKQVLLYTERGSAKLPAITLPSELLAGEYRLIASDFTVGLEDVEKLHQTSFDFIIDP